MLKDWTLCACAARSQTRPKDVTHLGCFETRQLAAFRLQAQSACLQLAMFTPCFFERVFAVDNVLSDVVMRPPAKLF
jgi:hypothetical protein